MNAVDDTVRELNRAGQACALFGSAVTGRLWAGSDINILALDDGREPVTSSATNYFWGDWALDTPRTTKRLVDGRLLEIDSYPAANLASALDDWILCDRLLGARPMGEMTGALAAAIEQVKALRWAPEVRRRRIGWYLSTVRRLRAAATAADEILMAIRVGAILLGCAALEIAGQPKLSYKRLHRQSLLAFTDARDAQDFSTCSGLGPDTASPPVVRSVLAEALAALTRVQNQFRKHRARALEVGPSRLLVGLRTTLEISADGVPPGKGIAENLAAGDPVLALDSLRKATLWLMNVLLRMRAADGPSPQPGRYLAALAGLELPDVDLAALARRVFGLDPQAAEDADAAQARLVARLADAELRAPAPPADGPPGP